MHGHLNVKLNQYVTVPESEAICFINTVMPLFVNEKSWMELRFSSLKQDLF